MSGQGTQGVRLGTATSMLTHSHTNGNSDETSAAGRSSINSPSRSARGSTLSPLRSGTVLEQQISLAAPVQGVEGRQVHTLTDRPATAAAARAAVASAPLLHRRVQGMMPVRPDNGDFVSLNRTAAIASPVRNTRYFRIGKVPIVKLDDPRDNRLPPYANTRPGTVRIAPPDDVPLSTILATPEVLTTSKELKEEPTDVTSVLKVLKAKSRKRCLLDRCDYSYDRAASNAVDTSSDRFSTEAVSDQRRDSKRRRLEEEEEEDKEDISCESIEMAAAGSSPIVGTKGSSEAADSTSVKNRAGALGPSRAKGNAGLDSTSRRNAIASSYSALLPVMPPKSQRKLGAVDLSAEESSEESVSRNGSTILVKSLTGNATQRSGTPASAAAGINSSCRSLVSDAAATDGGSLETKGASDVCGTPPSCERVPLRRRNPEIFHHLSDRFKNVPKATFTPSLEDYAIDELADRERLSRMVGGTVVAPTPAAVSVAAAAVVAGKPQLSASTAFATSSISAADKVPVIVPSLSAPSETSALSLRTTTSAERTTSAPASFSFGSADVTSGNRSNSTIAPPGGHHETDSGAASSTSSSADPVQTAGSSSVSTSQPPPPPTYASATASSGGTAAAVPVSISLSSTVVAPTQSAADPARLPLLFGGPGVSGAATSMGSQAATATTLSSATSFAQSSIVSSSAKSETQPSSGGLATLTKMSTVGSNMFTLPMQSLGQPQPSTAATAASSVAKSTLIVSSMTTLPSQTMGSGAGGIASAATTTATAGSVSCASTTASSSAAHTTATSNASGVVAFSFPSTFTTGSGSLFGAASRPEHASSAAAAAAVSSPSNTATTSLAAAVTSAPSLPTFGSGSVSLFGSSFGGKPSTSDTVDGGAQKQLTFTFGSATNGALPTTTASSVPAASSAPAIVSTPVTSSAPATSSVPAASSTPAGASAPAAAFVFGSGLFGAAKDKDPVAAGVATAAAPTAAPTFGLFSAAKDTDAAAGISASAAAPTFTFGGGLFGAVKDKDSQAPSATAAAAPAPAIPSFSFGGSGSSVAAKDVLGASSSMPGMTFAFGSNRPFGAAKDAATGAVTFGAGSVFGGAAGVAAQPPAFGGGSAAPQPSSGVFGAASAVKGVGGAFGVSADGTSASAVGSVPLLFGVSSSAAAPPATAATGGASGLPAASTTVAPALGIFGSTTLPAASTASTAVGAPSGSSSSVFGGLFGAGKVAAAATTAGSGLQPTLPFAFGQSAGANGTSSAGPTPTFGIGQAQPTASAGTGTPASQQAAALSGAAPPTGQQQPSFLFGSAATTAPSSAGSSNLFGTPAVTGAPAAFSFSFGGGIATAQPATQPAKTNGFNFGSATSPAGTFVFGAQANSATAGTTTPAASAFGMSPASFGATSLSSLPTGDQGSFTNMFTAGSASNSSVRQRQAVRRTGVAGRLGKR